MQFVITEYMLKKKGSTNFLIEYKKKRSIQVNSSLLLIFITLFERESNKYFLLCSKKSIDRTFSTPCRILNPESFSSSTLIQKYSNEQTIFLYSLSILPSNPALSFPFENKLVHLSTLLEGFSHVHAEANSRSKRWSFSRRSGGEERRGIPVT